MGFLPKTRSCVVLTSPSKKRYPTRNSVPARPDANEPSGPSMGACEEVRGG